MAVTKIDDFTLNRIEQSNKDVQEAVDALKNALLDQTLIEETVKNLKAELLRRSQSTQSLQQELKERYGEGQVDLKNKTFIHSKKEDVAPVESTLDVEEQDVQFADEN